jgi:phosphate:Na+ symporter
MVLLTDGLKAFAGQALQRALVRFTGTPARAFASGAVVTLMVQSSSATTVTLIGFVSAGLITFPQAVGVVMGASLGTTGTGWVVSVLGLKVSLGFYALPLVGIGALMRLLMQGRWRTLGLALAGFGLIFIGIETLQAGMQSVSTLFDLRKLPSAGVLGHLAAMAIGIILTIVMQSSSAAVATTLTALHAGAVNFEQAASLVIGAAVGTTVTGALASIGGSVSARRTAVSHVGFNLATGLIAIVLLPVLLRLLEWAQRHEWLEPGAVSLAAFHTLFISLGVVLFLPFTERIARRIEALLPDEGPRLARHLDESLLAAPAVAVEATRRALTEVALEVVDLLAPLLESGVGGVDPKRTAELSAAFDRTQHFFARIPPVSDDEPLSRSRVAQLHAIDHLARLSTRLAIKEALHRELAQPNLRPAVELCRQLLELVRQGLLGRAEAGWEAQVEEKAKALAALREAHRFDILKETAGGSRTPGDALSSLDALRWLERVGNHAWRAAHSLRAVEREAQGETPAAEPALDE